MSPFVGKRIRVQLESWLYANMLDIEDTDSATTVRSSDIGPSPTSLDEPRVGDLGSDDLREGHSKVATGASGAMGLKCDHRRLAQGTDCAGFGHLSEGTRPAPKCVLCYSAVAGDQER
jgi:hypothetical protein